MNKFNIKRLIAIVLLNVIFAQDVLADTSGLLNSMVNEIQTNVIEGIEDEILDEDTEPQVESTTETMISGMDMVISSSAIDVVTSSSAINDVVSNVDTEKVLEECADYKINEEDLTEEVKKLVKGNKFYSRVTPSDQYDLGQQLGVREDTMLECEENGLNIRRSVPIALIMQRMNIDFMDAINMIGNIGSQKEALKSAGGLFKKRVSNQLFNG